MRLVLFIFLFSVFPGGRLQSQHRGSPSPIYLFEDSSAYPDVQKVLALYKSHALPQAPENGRNISFTRSVYWLVYENNNDRARDSMLLYIGHHHINRIFFYFADSAAARLQWITGDYYPFRQRPIPATGFYFPITKKGIYLAEIDKRNESLQLSYHLTNIIQALGEESRTKTIMFLFTGMLFLLIIFGCYLFIIERENLYLYYVLYLATGWLWVFSNAGYGFEYLWPNLPWFASKARPVFVVAPIIFASLLLVRYIGGIKNRSFSNALRIVNLFLVTCIVFTLFVDDKNHWSSWWLYLQYIIPVVPLSYIIVSFIILAVASFRGNTLAKFYLVSQSALLFFAVLQISFSFGSLDGFDHFFSHYGLALGYVIEAIILTAGLVYRFNRYRLDKEKLLLKINSQQKENTRVLMQVQQEERGRVADQLHDVVGALLSAIKLNLSALRSKRLALDNSDAMQLEKTEEAVTTVSGIVRNLSHALSPVMLTQVGFRSALDKLAGMFNTSGALNIQVTVTGFDSFDPRLKQYYIALYSIIYELLNNIAKHSRATHALVQVLQDEDVFTIIAEDNGVGLASLPDANEGMGLAGIRSKVNYYNGLVAIDNLDSRGLVVTIEIPITYEENQDHIG